MKTKNLWRHKQEHKQLQWTHVNISKSKGNQAVKFGQLIEYNVRNISRRNTED